MTGSRRWRLAWLLAILPLALGSTCIIVEENPYDDPLYEGEAPGEMVEEAEEEEMDRRSDF
jgi:hypothetical protein